MKKGYLEEQCYNHHIDKQCNWQALEEHFDTWGTAPNATWLSPPLLKLRDNTQHKHTKFL